jgi:type I restriction enzyme S subunit
MSEHKENVPELRFPGFTGAWEERRLSDLAEVRTGKAFSSNSFSDEGEYLVVTNKNIQDDANGTSVGDRMDIFEGTILNNYLLSGDNILVTMDGVNIGKTGKYSNEKAVLAQRVGRLNSEQLEFVFQITCSNKFVSEMNKLSVGNAIKHISLKQISDYSFSAPMSEEEQEKVGTFFNQLDHLITLYQHKLNNVKNMKDGLLQRMFPKNDEDFPEVRFPGYTDAWEQRKVSEMVSVTYGGGTPKTSEKDYWDGNIPWIQSSDLTDGKVLEAVIKKRISNSGLQNSAAKLVPPNSIAIVTRVGVGKLVFMPFEYTTSQDFLSLSGLQSEPWFSVYALYKKLQNELNAVQGTSIKGITKEELLSKVLMLPSDINEQTQIGRLFKQLDTLITLHQRKLEHLQEQKKALLQQMFV